MIWIFLMLYENFYYMIFTDHSVGKIWSSIRVQDSVKSALHYQTTVIRLIWLVFCIRFVWQTVDDYIIR